MRAGLTNAGRRVLDTAAELFYARGIAAVGVAEIAETAGVTKKTLYDCFGSKAALVVAYLEDRDQRWWAHLEHRLASAPHALTVLEGYLEHPDLRLERGCAFLNAAAELPADHPALAVVRRHKDAVLARLETLTGDSDLAEHVFLLLEAATTHQRLGHEGHVAMARRIVADLTRPSPT